MNLRTPFGEGPYCVHPGAPLRNVSHSYSLEAGFEFKVLTRSCSLNADRQRRQSHPTWLSYLYPHNVIAPRANDLADPHICQDSTAHSVTSTAHFSKLGLSQIEPSFPHNQRAQRVPRFSRAPSDPPNRPPSHDTPAIHRGFSLYPICPRHS